MLLGNFVYFNSKMLGARVPSQALPHEEYDAEAVASAHKKAGFRAAYAPMLPLNDVKRLQNVDACFAEAGVTLAELGVWDNLMDLDETERKNSFEKVCSALAAADEMGVRCVVNSVGGFTYGTVNDNYNASNLSEYAFALAVDTTKEILRTANPRRTVFSIEPFVYTCIDTMEAYERFLDAVDDTRLKVHMDLSNFVRSPREFFCYDDMIQEMVRRFSGRIVSAHIKDLKLVSPSTAISIQEVMLGDGGLNLSGYMKALHELNVPCLSEHFTREEDFIEAGKRLFSIAEKAGIPV